MMKTKKMNNILTSDTEFLSWTDVDKAIGSEARKELQPKLQSARRLKRIAEAVGIGAAILFLAILLTFLAGCATPAGRTTYTTIAGTVQAVKLAYDGYTDSVIHGDTRTNEVPVVSHSFDAFMASARISIDAAAGNTNAPATEDLSAAASNVLAAINAAKGKK